jgi:hypothetical protein
MRRTRKYYFGALYVLCGSWCFSCSGDATQPIADADLQNSDDAEADEEFVRENMVPLSDGIELFTLATLPTDGEPPYSAILLRTPYSFYGDPRSLMDYYVTQGYATVLQDVRGTGESEGELRPLQQEVGDGCETVRWVLEQPWSNGRIATIGASYEGFTAIAAAVGCPELTVAIADGAPVDGYLGWPGDEGGTGALNLIDWYYLLDHGVFASETEYTRMTELHPTVSLDIELLGREIPFWREYLGHASSRDDFWDEMSLTPRFGEITSPVIHLEARYEWTDDGMKAFLGLRHGAGSEGGRDSQFFVLGAHEHGSVVYEPSATSPAQELVRDALAFYLDGEDNAFDERPRVLFHLEEAGTWHEAPGWPPDGEEHVLYLANGSTPDEGTLSEEQVDSSAISYDFDPEHENPCEDALEYSLYLGPVLEAPLDVVGSPSADISVSSTSPDADVFVLLEEVTATGEWNMIRYGSLRLRFRDSLDNPEMLEPGEIVTAHVRMPTFARHFPAGSSLALYVVSAVCSFHENTQTGEPIGFETNYQSSTITIYADRYHPSVLHLPVVEIE